MDSYRSLLSLLRAYPRLSTAIGISVSYLTYYLLFVAKHPRIAGNPKIKKFLLQHCGELKRRFWPTIWCIETRGQTIIRALLKSSPSVLYERPSDEGVRLLTREVLRTPDGGQFALDWVDCPAKGIHSKQTQPIVLILPGLTGSSNESYVRHLALQAVSSNYRAVVFNNRGNGGVKLLTGRTYNACNIEDLTLVVNHIKARYPKAPVMGTGISMGGITLITYLIKTGDDCPLVGGMACCTPFEIFESCISLEKPLNLFVFNWHLASNLRNTVYEYKDMFADKVDFSRVMKTKTIQQFDEHFTAKQFGYTSHLDYYKESCTHDKLRHVKVPLLLLNADDDPFSPNHVLPYEEVNKSDHVALVVTSHGGHIGFLDGLFPRNQNYMDRVFKQWVDSIFTHGEELRKQQQ